ncbi:hypothetical protein GCM10010136_29180 [Limoniibacter endophyticus]|uniref:Cupin type-2 domain-containing protein n=2 Tax=Limoniibacter endophyticus TaxID=1565040 RepID=A0A8J3DJD5_9HYPH|nr:hypothetical protein GCM10010136_29180 [Limoniibacter endophyticus]
MLVSVEAGDVNISLGKLDAIAIALGVSFARIVSDSSPPSPHGEIVWRGHSPNSQAVLVGTATVRREAEFWLWSLEPGEFYQGEPDPEGYQEALIVQEGQLVLTIDRETERILPAGTFTLFDSSKTYRYTNVGTEIVRFLRTVLN